MVTYKGGNKFILYFRAKESISLNWPLFFWLQDVCLYSGNLSEAKPESDYSTGSRGAWQSADPGHYSAVPAELAEKHGSLLSEQCPLSRWSFSRTRLPCPASGNLVPILGRDLLLAAWGHGGLGVQRHKCLMAGSFVFCDPALSVFSWLH